MTDLIPLDAAIAAANDAVLKYLTEDFETPPEAYIREALRAIPVIDPAAIREAALREAAAEIKLWWASVDDAREPDELIITLIGEKK